MRIAGININDINHRLPKGGGGGAEADSPERFRLTHPLQNQSSISFALVSLAGACATPW
jgi:hypothetical protein